MNCSFNLQRHRLRSGNPEHTRYLPCADRTQCLQVRAGLTAYIAGCMSGRGAMAGAGCGIACKCSMLRFQAPLWSLDTLLLPGRPSPSAPSIAWSAHHAITLPAHIPLVLPSITAQEILMRSQHQRTGMALERWLTRSGAGAGAVMSSSASRIRAESTADCLRYSMQLGRLVMSTEPESAKSCGGRLKSSAWRHCSHFKHTCRWLLYLSQK